MNIKEVGRMKYRKERLFGSFTGSLIYLLFLTKRELKDILITTMAFIISYLLSEIFIWRRKKQ